MEIGVKVLAEHFQTGEKKHILSAYFTFVAVDENGRPTQVPQLIPQTPLEQRRFEEAERRRETRKLQADERKILREKFKDPSQPQ